MEGSRPLNAGRRHGVAQTSGVVVKYPHEFAVRNRPQGDKLWVRFSFPL
ncbi:hypothetical protein [Burkholderia sp. Ac-20344]|nr:hypothetical protein [Burkholderia sp. Ac-20344]